MSWWPQPHYWDKSAYNVGYWSPWAEGWFLARLSKIRSGDAEIYGSKRWGEHLKSGKIAKTVRNAVEDAAALFLTRDLRIYVSD